MSVHVFDILKIRFIINFELDFWFCPTYKHCRHNRRKFLTIFAIFFFQGTWLETAKILKKQDLTLEEVVSIDLLDAHLEDLQEELEDLGNQKLLVLGQTVCLQVPRRLQKKALHHNDVLLQAKSKYLMIRNKINAENKFTFLHLKSQIFPTHQLLKLC